MAERFYVATLEGICMRAFDGCDGWSADAYVIDRLNAHRVAGAFHSMGNNYLRKDAARAKVRRQAEQRAAELNAA